MKLREATEADFHTLNSFYASFSNSGPIETLQRRYRPMNEIYGPQGRTSRIFIFENRVGEIEGMVSFVIVDCILDSHLKRIAFARDLRIRQTREAILGWTSFFLPTLQRIQEEEKLDHFFTCISDYEMLALNSFVRNRSIDKPIPRYVLFSKWNLVSIHGKWPRMKNPLPHLKIKLGSQISDSKLHEYYLRTFAQRDFNTLYNDSMIDQAFAAWPNLHRDDVVTLVNAKDEIVGACALWSPNGVAQYDALKLNSQATNFRNLLTLLHLINRARPLTISDSQDRNYLNFRQMTYVSCLTPDVFECLIWHCYHLCPQREFLVYGYSKEDFRMTPPKKLITNTWPFGIYAMIPPMQSLPSFLGPHHSNSLTFEPFFAL